MIGRLSGKRPSMPKGELDINCRTSTKNGLFGIVALERITCYFTFAHLHILAQAISHELTFLIAFGCLIRLALDEITNVDGEYLL